MTLQRFWILAALGACADAPTEMPAGSELSTVASVERATSDIVPSYGIDDDGTILRADVYLSDRLGEAKSVELSDGEYLVLVAGGQHVVLARAPQVHAWETMVHYVGEVPLTDAGQVAVDFRRSDGSVAHSTVVLPAAFAIADAPTVARAGDLVDVALAPGPDHETWGLASVQCDGGDASATGSVYAKGDGTPAQVGIATLAMAPGQTSCDAVLTVGLHASEGGYDASFGGPHGDLPLGVQRRATRMTYYP